MLETYPSILELLSQKNEKLAPLGKEQNIPPINVNSTI
jgi:hypothetical protein